MCDYSLMAFPNRLAKNGERLIVHEFACGAIGLASPTNLPADRQSLLVRVSAMWRTFWGFTLKPGAVVAVCVPDGARLLVMDIPEYLQRDLNVGHREDVIFRQLSGSSFQYRDAIRFRNGRQILLQKLREGQRVRVLHLGGENVENEAVLLDDRATIWRREEIEVAAHTRSPITHPALNTSVS
jgi:hypothetical protein